jgi:hypothetical protein
VEHYPETDFEKKVGAKIRRQWTNCGDDEVEALTYRPVQTLVDLTGVDLTGVDLTGVIMTEV